MSRDDMGRTVALPRRGGRHRSCGRMARRLRGERTEIGHPSRNEFEYLLGIRLGFAGDDRRGNARGLRQGRQEQRKNCNKSMIVRSSLHPKQHFQNW